MANQFVTKRRKFLAQSLTLALSFSSIPSLAGIPKLKSIQSFDAGPALPAELVHEFVAAAHINLPKVKEMLTKEPMLANACWDWGGGDFELAIGGAAHMGNRDIANYLLDNNARIDIFCAAMLGEAGVVGSLLKMRPDMANVPGPHKFPLLYHVAISGDVTMASLIKPAIAKERMARDANRSLQAAARGGHISMVEWLLANGADDPNIKDILGRTPLQMAEEKGYKEVASLLKNHGAK